MTSDQLRDKLADSRINISALGRLSKVPVRTLFRIKSGESDALQSTIERIRPHLAKARSSKGR